VGQDGLDLLTSYARKPLQKVVNAGTRFQVLEKGFDGNAGSFENPSAAHLSGDAFDGGALGPVEHVAIVSGNPAFIAATRDRM